MKILVSNIEQHQKDAVLFAIGRPYGILNYATGSGKSIISILIGFSLLLHKKVQKVLLVSTKSGLISLNEDFNTNTDQKPKIITDLHSMLSFLSDQETHFGLINYNVLENSIIEYLPVAGKVLKDLPKALKTALRSMNICLIFDEYHTLKTRTSKVTKNWSLFRRYASNVYGLTASSYFKDIFDIYSLVHFLDKKFFGTLTVFRENYTILKMMKLYRNKQTQEIPQVIGYKNLDILEKNLDNIMLCYNPELDVEYKIHEVSLSNKDEYISAAKGLFDIYDTDKIDPKQWSARLVDLQKVVDRDTSKAIGLKRILDSLKDTGCVIYTSTRESIDIISTVLTDSNFEYEVISGDVSSKNRKKYKDWFIKTPAYKCLIITDAGGASLNLQAVNNLVFFNLPFGIGKFIQVRGRIVRQFSKYDKFFIHILQATNTIDEYKHIKITQQQQIYSSIFGVSVANEDATYTEVSGLIIQDMKTKKLWVKD